MLLDRDTVRAIQVVLATLRRDISDLASELAQGSPTERLLNGVSLQVEGIRSRFSTLNSTGLLRNEKLASRILTDFENGMEIIASNIEFIEYARNIPVSNPRNFPAHAERQDIIFQIMNDATNTRQLIFNLRSFATYVRNQRSLFDLTDETSNLSDLKRVAPAQKVGPIQLQIVDSKLSIAPQAALPAEIDLENVSNARSDITKRGDLLIQELKASNNDPRLIAEIERINDTIDRSKNVIEIGIANIGCGMMGAALKNEMSPALSAMLSTYTMSIDMYVAQFPDWNRFVEQAALVKLDEVDIIHIRNAASIAVEKLKARSDIVDPEVPKTFQVLLRLLDNPANSSKRAAFAVLRSVENLISKTISFVGDLAEKTKEKSIDKLSGVLASALVAGLLTIALSASTSVAPVAAKINELQWLKNAIEVVQEHLAKIKAGSE